MRTEMGDRASKEASKLRKSLSKKKYSESSIKGYGDYQLVKSKKSNIKVYWYSLDPKMSSWWERIGIHFFGYGFEISLVRRNLIITWGKEE
jgi:hypothetical protein